MDTLKDFFSDLKDRITNPFVSSFAISWLVINYKIVIALFFYKVANYNVFISIISENSNWWVSFWKPVVCALIYTFIFQAFKAVIKGFNSWLLFFTNKIIFKWTGDYPISVTEHKMAADELSKLQEEYSVLIASKSIIKTENNKLLLEMGELKLEHENEIRQLNQDKEFAVLNAIEEEQRRVSYLNLVATDNGMDIGRLTNELKELKESHLNQIKLIEDDFRTTTKTLSETISNNQKQVKSILEYYKNDVFNIVDELETVVVKFESDIENKPAIQLSIVELFHNLRSTIQLHFDNM